LITVKALNQVHPCCSSYGQMIEDIQVRLLSFPYCVVQHVGRKANTAAHTLAKYVLSLSFELVWLDECPHSIHYIVTSE
jgi:hypothetical protein